MVSAPTVQSPVLFHSVLRPRGAAGPRQVRILVAVVAGALAVTGIGFVLAGAWPVVGFCGLEVGLLSGALRFYRGAGRATETLRLTKRELTVTRVDRRGRTQSWSFQPYWLQVSVRNHGQIELRSHGRAVFVGAALGEGDRQRLAAELNRALAPLSGIVSGVRPRPDDGTAPCAPCRPAAV